jgi:hypothetical protein
LKRALLVRRLDVLPDTAVERFITLPSDPPLVQQMAKFLRTIGVQAIERGGRLIGVDVALNRSD